MASSIIEMANSIPSQDKDGREVDSPLGIWPPPSYVTTKGRMEGACCSMDEWSLWRVCASSSSLDYYNVLVVFSHWGMQSHAQSREHTTVSLKRIMPTVAFQVWARANRITS
jgi:hypothetical protein